MRKLISRGFTMIELLVVIAVLGVLAVAVLAAINPIEQINRGKDTGTRSDCEQLLSAIDRFYTAMGYYPWRSSPTDGNDAQDWTRITSVDAWQDDTGTNVLEKLSSGGTAELKASFVSRITGAGYNYLWVYNGGLPGNSTYICFNPLSASFQKEAKDRCEGKKGSIPSDLESQRDNICGVTVDGKEDQYLICLP